MQALDPRIVEVERSGLDLYSELLGQVRTQGIVLARDVKLAQPAFASFVSALGTTITHSFLAASGNSGVSTLERGSDGVGDVIYGGAWHQNLMFLASPPDVTVLYADNIGDLSNFTAFVDLAEVAPWYSEGVKRLLKQSAAIHSTSAPHSPQNFFKGGSVTGLDVFASEQSAVHPAYVMDPETGLSWPFVMSNYVVNIQGWKPSESMPLVDTLRQFAVHDEFVIRHYWRQGDLVLWDNRRFMHRATVTHKVGNRRLWRADLNVDWSTQPA